MTLVVCADHDTPVPRADRISGCVVAVAGLCSDPSALIDAGVRDPEALILHLGEFDLGFMQGAIRDTGGDPLSVPLVTLSDMPSLDQVETLAAGALARHASFDRTRPDCSKLRWPKSVWRSRFFSLSVPQCVGVPSIEASLCISERGCRLCVDTCPASALMWGSGGVVYDVTTCVSCGICVTTCPPAATNNPTVSEDQVSGQIAAMVDTAVGTIGIEFRCRDAPPQPPAEGWFPVEVPCTGMLGVGWLIAPLVLGAGAVAAPTCSESGCSIGNDDTLAPRRDAARELLDELGLASGMVRDRAGDTIPEAIGTDTTRRLGTFRDTEVFLALADITGTTDGVLSSETASAGVVIIDASTCTVCEQCVSVCPSGALTSETFGGITEILFDPFACIGCAMCVDTCPEVEHHAITLERSIEAVDLTVGNRVLLSASVTTRGRHRGASTSVVVLERVESMPEPEHSSIIDPASSSCLN